MLIVTRDDHLSLRLALVIETARPGTSLIATVHGRIIAAQLERVVENARVISRADIVAPVLAAACFDERLLLVQQTDDGWRGVEARNGTPELRSIEPSRQGFAERALANVGSLVNPFEVSGRILGGTYLAAAALGSDASGAFLHEQIVCLVTPDGEIEQFHDVEAEQSEANAAAHSGAPGDRTDE